MRICELGWKIKFDLSILWKCCIFHCLECSIVLANWVATERSLMSAVMHWSTASFLWIGSLEWCLLWPFLTSTAIRILFLIFIPFITRKQHSERTDLPWEPLVHATVIRHWPIWWEMLPMKKNHVVSGSSKERGVRIRMYSLDSTVIRFLADYSSISPKYSNYKLLCVWGMRLLSCYLGLYWWLDMCGQSAWKTAVGSYCVASSMNHRSGSTTLSTQKFMCTRNHSKRRTRAQPHSSHVSQAEFASGTMEFLGILSILLKMDQNVMSGSGMAYIRTITWDTHYISVTCKSCPDP